MVKRSNKAFSLVELVATLVVLSLVTLIAYPTYLKTKTNSATNEEITSLNNFSNAAFSLARSDGRVSTLPADWFKAISEQNSSGRPLTVLISTFTTPNVSTGQGVISVTDIAYDGTVGLAMYSATGKCLYSQVTSEAGNNTWVSNDLAGSNCNGFYASNLAPGAS